MKEAFGDRLKRLRTAAGLSQKQLADAAGLSQNAVSQWEGGSREPSYSALQALIHAMKVDSREFFEPASGGRAADAIGEAVASKPAASQAKRGRPAKTAPAEKDVPPTEGKPIQSKPRGRRKPRG